MATSIAIVGIAAELPSGNYSDKNLDYEGFFQFLLDSGEAYERIPSDRFDISTWKGKGAGRVSADKGAFLKDVDMFDNLEFGVSQKDARAMAPSTKKLLQTSFLALLDSGINYRTRNVGCYTSGILWEGVGVPDPDEFESPGSFASAPAMIANRVSYHLDLLGPSVPTDTACSSSLTGLHLAVQAVSRGECEAAVVAGCQLNYRLADWLHYSSGGLLAKDGKCKPFDASANGFSRGEGVVAVVIKPLQDALRDHDRIYATVIGTAINSGGSGLPSGAPVADAQCEAMRQAYKEAQRNPREADFVECHATGTGKGDPTEVGWVSENFHRDDELLLGSVKGNIGHLEITAFLASLTKVIGIFEHGIIPPNVNLKTRNPAIKWDEHRIRVPLEPTPLPRRSNAKSMISMASAGIGGASGHVVLESAPSTHVLTKEPPKELNGETTPRPVLLMAGGLTPRSVASIADSISELATAKGYSELLSMSTIFGRRSRQMTWRSFAVVEPGQKTIKFSQGSLSPRVKPPVVFFFCGQGPQHRDMGRELFRIFSAFRTSILECDETYKKVTGKSMVNDYGLFDDVTPTTELAEPWSIEFVVPAISIYQIALCDLLASLGVKPDIVTGHSAGETAVFYACGAGPKAMAVELAIARGKAYATLENTDSTMAALSCSPREATSLINEARRKLSPEDVVEIGCFNSPVAVTLSGKVKGIDEVLRLAEGKGIWCRKIRTRVPNHSSLMEGCREMLVSMCKDIFARYPGVHTPLTATVYSTVTGKEFAEPFADDYFWLNARGRVHFTQAIQSIIAANPSVTAIEMAPHPVLSSYVSNMVGDSPVTCPARRPKKGESLMEHSKLLHFLGEFTSLGYNGLDFTLLNGRACYEGRVAIPAYPFVMKPFPLWVDNEAWAKQVDHRNGPLNHKALKVSKELFPSLAEHVVRGEPIMPAAGYLEMAIEFGAQVLFDVEIHSILPLPSEKPLKVAVDLDGLHWTVKSTPSSHSSGPQPLQPSKTHAEGFLSFDIPKQNYPMLNLAEIRSRCTSRFTSDIYPSLAFFSSYGPLFQRLVDVSYNANEALATIKGMDEDLLNDPAYYLHPAILDACFQLTAFKFLNGNYDPNVYYLPARVGTLVVHRPLKKQFFPTAQVFAHIVFKSWSPEEMQYDIAVVDERGERLCTLESFVVSRHRIWPLNEVGRRFDVIYQPISHAPRTKVDKTPEFESEDTVALYDLLDRFAYAAQGVQSCILPDSLSDLKRVFSPEVAPFAVNGHTVNGHHCSGCPIHCHTSPTTNDHSPHKMNGLNGHVDEDKPNPSADDMQRRKSWAGSAELSDKLFIACEALLSNLQQKWPEHFDLLEKRKAGSDIDAIARATPHMSYVLRQSVHAVRNALASFVADDERRIVRVFVSNDSAFSISIVSKAIREFPSLFVDVFVANASESMNIDPHLGIGHFGPFDVTKTLEEQALQPNSFDVIVSCNFISADVDKKLALEKYSNLLVPGGSLVLVEKDGRSWHGHRPGTAWYDYVFAVQDPSTMFSSDDITQLLEENHIVPLKQLANTDVDPFHVIIEAQKSTSDTSASAAPLYDDSESYTIDYHFGEELDLQWVISGLDPAQKLDVWIVASSGRDGDAAMGLTRALRREILEWTIRLVIFPESFDSDLRREKLEKLPQWVCYEPDLVFTSGGDITVPRLVPVSAPDTRTLSTAASIPTDIPEGHVLVRVKTSSQSESCFSFIATIVSSSVDGFSEGAFIAGLVGSLSNEYVVVNASNICLIPSNLNTDLGILATNLPGYVSAVLAPSQRLAKQPSNLASLRILLTHRNTPIGRGISHFYGAIGVKTTEVNDDIDVLSLSKLGLGSFDIVVSGYRERGFVQVAKKLLKPSRGQIFLWNDGFDGLSALLEKAPWTIGYALQEAIAVVKDIPASPGVIVQTSTTTWSQSIDGDANAQPIRLFAPSKSYLLLGGIGCLGAHIALWMYQRGARKIVATSRQGKNGLEKHSNLMAQRMFTYLESLPDLTIRFERVDATSTEDMKTLVESLGSDLAGCMMLAGLSKDHLFVHIPEDDFASVFSPKVTGMEIFEALVDIKSLEFLVALTSASGTFGIGGQANYAAANTALDGMVARYSNAFAFSAPAIFDTAFILTSGIDMKNPAFSPIIEWAMSAEDMIQWLEDGILKIRGGDKLRTYIPDLNWAALARTLGMTKIGQHLVPTEVTATSQSTVDEAELMAEIIIKTLTIPREEFSHEVPFTSYGLDSLSASRLAYSLHSVVEVTQIQLLADMTLEDLLKRKADASQEKDKGHGATEAKSDSAQVQAHVEAMEEMLAKYTKDFPVRPAPIASEVVAASESSEVEHREDVVLLTGTTGVLGCNIMTQLIDSPDVKRVYAFNRPRKSISLMERQIHMLEDQGLSSSYVDSEKLILVEADTAATALGVSDDFMEELLSSVTHIIHNAWLVDINAPLSTFDDNVKGTRQLVDFALNSKLPAPPTLSFISTIGLYREPKEAVIMPEGPIDDPSVAVQSGYPESKWIAEQLLMEASANTPLKTVVIRVGQMAGGLNGAWNPIQWVPSIVKSGLSLGCLPNGNDTVSWLPIHLGAAAIAEMRSAPTGTLHIAHPNPVSWESVFEPLATILNVPLVPYAEWFDRLQKNLFESNGENEIDNPALKLLDFYRVSFEVTDTPEDIRVTRDCLGLLPRVAMEKSKEASKTLNDPDLPQIGKDDAARWIQHWRDIGFLPPATN